MRSYLVAAGVLLWHGVAAAESGLAPELPALEELSRTEITSVGRRTQSLADVAAAAFVISAEDIRRSGAVALPDVLRMVPGMEVAQIDSGRYAVSARGFNSRFAQKLQVLVDGRSIYQPLFSGAVWESDPIPLSEIERVEVMRGPGAAMWGANAVNGVINIISRKAAEQPGGQVEARVGTADQRGLAMRYAARPDETSAWRLATQLRHAGASRQAGNAAAGEDHLENGTVDFRFDKDLSAGRNLTMWASAVRASVGQFWYDYPQFVGGVFAGARQRPVGQQFHSDTLMGRYRWLGDAGIESSLQMSLTRSGFDLDEFFREHRTTMDVDYQGRRAFGFHDVLWGGSHRRSNDDIVNGQGALFSVLPEQRHLQSSALFVQDAWTLLPDLLTFEAGGRWEHSSIGGSAFSPNLAWLWTPTPSDTVWLRYSRAPRMPSRIEEGIAMFANMTDPSPASGGLPVLTRLSGSVLRPESIEGAEVGLRQQWRSTLQSDLVVYRYRYSGLRAATTVGAPQVASVGGGTVLIQDLVACNCLSGWLSGVELATDWLPMSNWRLQLSLTLQSMSLSESDDAAQLATARGFERAMPKRYASLRSQWNLAAGRQFDAWLRASSGIEQSDLPSASMVGNAGYVTLDLRYSQQVDRTMEVALVGRNLLGGRRVEYRSDYLPAVPVEVGPSLALTARWGF